MYSEVNIKSNDDVIFFLNDVIMLTKFYKKYHDRCKFISYDEIVCIPDDVNEIIEKINLFLINNYYN